MANSVSKYPKLSRSVLRSIYNCYGHFYTLKINDNFSIKCRSVLEIVNTNRDNLNDLSNLSSLIPEAIVIMMNPGSSQPVYESEKEEIILASDHIISFKGKALVKAIPDGTQDRIMNIMNVMKWDHIRILNLSDIREKDSDVLETIMSNFQRSASIDTHSIFSTIREKERNEALVNGESLRFILGWGTLPCLNIIALEVLKHLKSGSSRRLFGLEQNEPNYYHPGRTKNWHDQIIDQLVNM